MTYLKPSGTMVFVLDRPDRALIEDLSRSKKYETSVAQNLVLLSKRS